MTQLLKQACLYKTEMLATLDRDCASWNNTQEQGVSVIKITRICTPFPNWPSSQESPVLRGCTLSSPSCFDTSSLTLKQAQRTAPTPLCWTCKGGPCLEVSPIWSSEKVIFLSLN